MDLSTYLIKHKLSSKRFAKLVGCSASAVQKWRRKRYNKTTNGFRRPRAALMRKIARITKGAVTPADWY